MKRPTRTSTRKLPARSPAGQRTAIQSALMLGSFMLITLTMTGCETLKGLLSLERPEVTLEDVSISSLTFEDVGLVADLMIHNPNPIGITLAGFSYSVEIEGTPIIAGDQSEGVAIESFGDSPVRLPFDIGFADLIETYQVAKDKDEVAYRLDLAFRFELPVLGIVSIPISHDGVLPVLRVPTLEVTRLSMDSIKLSGADLKLTLQVSNPNAFAATFPALEYRFDVQGQSWVSGAVSDPISIPAKGQGQVTIPFNLSFLSFGRTLRDLLLGDDAINYELAGNLTVDLDLDLISARVIPFEFGGAIPLVR